MGRLVYDSWATGLRHLLGGVTATPWVHRCIQRRQSRDGRLYATLSKGSKIVVFVYIHNTILLTPTLDRTACCRILGMHMLAVYGVRTKSEVLNRSIWLCRNRNPHSEHSDPGSKNEDSGLVESQGGAEGPFTNTKFVYGEFVYMPSTQPLVARHIVGDTHIHRPSTLARKQQEDPHYYSSSSVW